MRLKQTKLNKGLRDFTKVKVGKVETLLGKLDDLIDELENEKAYFAKPEWKTDFFKRTSALLKGININISIADLRLLDSP